jgi:pentose-5-phosphate-3-epimerase
MVKESDDPFVTIDFENNNTTEKSLSEYIQTETKNMISFNPSAGVTLVDKLLKLKIPRMSYELIEFLTQPGVIF